MAADGAGEPTVVAVGTARLPKTVGGDEPAPLMIELSYSPEDGRIRDVSTTLPLRCYAQLLRSVLVGRAVDAVEPATAELSERIRGPLQRPTVAALLSAASNCDRRPDRARAM